MIAQLRAYTQHRRGTSTRPIYTRISECHPDDNPYIVTSNYVSIILFITYIPSLLRKDNAFGLERPLSFVVGS